MSKYSLLTPEQKRRRIDSVLRWQKRNKETVKAKVSKWAKENPARRREINDAWKARNRAKVAKNKAERRGHCWMLTEEQYLDITANPCHYCGEALPKTYGGLDRIDNSKGYELGNVLPCCTTCNITRNEFYTVEEMEIMISALIEYRKLRTA